MLSGGHSNQVCLFTGQLYLDYQVSTYSTVQLYDGHQWVSFPDLTPSPLPGLSQHYTGTATTTTEPLHIISIFHQTFSFGTKTDLEYSDLIIL